MCFRGVGGRSAAESRGSALPLKAARDGQFTDRAAGLPATSPLLPAGGEDFGYFARNAECRSHGVPPQAVKNGPASGVGCGYFESGCRGFDSRRAAVLRVAQLVEHRQAARPP